MPTLFIHHLYVVKLLLHSILNNFFECVILLYSTPGFQNMMAVRKHVRNVGVFWKLNTPTDIFMNMLEKCIPWTQKLLFCGINSQYITPCIINLIKTNKTGEYRISICDQFEIDRTTLDNAVRNLPPLPEGNTYIFKILNFQGSYFVIGYEIRQLTLKDAPIVLDPWRENAFDFYSLEQVQFCIRHLPSLGEELYF